MAEHMREYIEEYMEEYIEECMEECVEEYIRERIEEYIEKYAPRVLKGRADQMLIYDYRLHVISRKFNKWLDTKINIKSYFEHV